MKIFVRKYYSNYSATAGGNRAIAESPEAAVLKLLKEIIPVEIVVDIPPEIH